MLTSVHCDIKMEGLRQQAHTHLRIVTTSDQTCMSCSSDGCRPPGRGGRTLRFCSTFKLKSLHFAATLTVLPNLIVGHEPSHAFELVMQYIEGSAGRMHQLRYDQLLQV